jgi:hypothetical protein
VCVSKHNKMRDFFCNFPIYLRSVTIHSDTFSKRCVGKRGRVEQCSVAPLRNKRAKTVCGCREKRVQTEEKYKEFVNILLNWAALTVFSYLIVPKDYKG